MKRPALFLDRDGVINVDHGYVYQAENFSFLPGIFELVQFANKLNYLVIVVTNQSGIGRGYYTEKDFHKLMTWMKARFKEHEAEIDGIYFCPFHPEYGVGEYRRTSDLRKPGPGMIMCAADDFGIDLSHSIMVGDNITDMQAGLAAGVGTLLYLGQQPTSVGINIHSLTEVHAYLSANVSS
ncbi:D,D-heptose 1,7-bisphosphate phosphatase [Chitiniphilus shinanonensis]|uniref:D,D-heptose 1,7-bisphosphate phosphatase n=1 Tax=Chitiniphilus shinanonensis TaxID=553088 RepID=A0ABQ6BPS4_9NEIS|nr:HAD family hydrolase [Chitiniphilus shinanonensis]GLS03831.1 D,D-heptose 1,7-bisphosphate phosphatase [Chitiniphilus shinanonensis]